MLSNIGQAAIRRICAGGQQSTNRALQTILFVRRVAKSHAAVVSCSSTFLRHGHRSYATATVTKAAPKKAATTKAAAVKPKAKKAATKKTKPKKAVKKPVKKKVVKKAKAKPKAKPVKKVLTEEQKSKLAEKTERAALKKLKEIALLSTAPPHGSPSAWTLFSLETWKAGNHPSGTSYVDLVPSYSAKWKSLSPAELESYNHIANQTKVDREVAFKQWVESHTPDQIRAANNARISLARKDPKHASKYYKIKDARLPKRPLTPPLIFAQDRQSSGDYKGIGFGDRAKLIKKEYDSLPATERKVYEDRFAALKEQYQQEFETVYGRKSRGAPA